MNLNLAGRHALVCGASQGIGRASAVELALLGANVTVLARSADALKDVVAALPRVHDQQRHGYRAADMHDTAALREHAAEIIARQPVEILIHNSGGPKGGPLNQAEEDELDRAFRQHVLAGQALMQTVLPGMRAQRYGRLVNIISTSVREPIAGLGVSNTVRAAVAAWAKTLAGELAADGITVNNVLPGYTRTARLDAIVSAGAQRSGHSEQQVAEELARSVPAQRFGEPEEIAAMVAFLCTPAAAYVNGTSIAVDGGRTKALA